jgi:hypothetical protein
MGSFPQSYRLTNLIHIYTITLQFVGIKTRDVNPWNDNSLINFPIDKYEAYTNMYIHIEFMMVVLI